MRGKSILTKSQWCLLFLLPIAACSVATSKVIYVDNDAIGANDGSSWENAYVYLQDALADANSVEKPVEIIVAKGIYMPDRGLIQIPGDRKATFQLINGVTLKGGYAGLGETDPNDRDIDAYETILSGDLNSNDAEIADISDLRSEPTRAENSYNVVTGSGTDDSAVLDGFTITGGNANGPTPKSSGVSWRFIYGAGMSNEFGSPIVANCTFTWNSADCGGGMNNESGNPIIINCIFSKNYAWAAGGGMQNYRKSTVTLTNCTFSENMVYYAGGGGIANSESSLILTDCAFIKNSAEGGGGIASTASSSLSLTNCTFVRNSGGLGGGGMYGGTSKLTNCAFIANKASTAGGIGACTCSVVNCTFIANKAKEWGGGMWSGLNNTVSNCIFSGNSAGICGAAIYIGVSSNLIITNCTLTGNSAKNGNALASDEFFRIPSLPSNVELTNCIVWDSGNEIWNGYGSPITISYSDIQGGQVDVYDPYGTVVWGQGNIDTDPLFADSGYWVDVNDPNVIIVKPSDPNAVWIDGDYHLKSEAGRLDPNNESWVIDDVTSPCIDASDPLTPVMYEPHPRGCFINMGAYGGTKEASKSPFNCPYKLDGERQN